MAAIFALPAWPTAHLWSKHMLQYIGYLQFWVWRMLGYGPDFNDSGAQTMSVHRLLRLVLATLAFGLLTACAGMNASQRAQLEISQDPRGVAIASRDSNLFLPGSATLQPDSAPFFDRVSQLLQDKPERKALIDSVSDNTGSAEYNQELQEVRALSIMKALITRGIDRSRLAYVTGSSASPAPGAMTPVEPAVPQSKIIILGASTADMNVNTLERFFDDISNFGKSLFK